MQIVFHSAELARVKNVFNNVKNLIKEIEKHSTKDCVDNPQAFKICVVFNSDAVKTLVLNNEESQKIDWHSLPENIELLVCQNSLTGMSIDSNELIIKATIIPSGVYQLAILQSQGFHYIRP